MANSIVRTKDKLDKVVVPFQYKIEATPENFPKINSNFEELNRFMQQRGCPTNYGPYDGDDAVIDFSREPFVSENQHIYDGPARMVEWMRKKKESFNFAPLGKVNLGGRELSFDEYCVKIGRCYKWLVWMSSQIKDPDLAREERKSAEKIHPVAFGVAGFSDSTLIPDFNQNKSNAFLSDPVATWMKDHIREAYLSQPDDVRDLSGYPIDVDKFPGTYLFSTTVDEARTLTARYTAARLGNALARGELSLKKLIDMWPFEAQVPVFCFGYLKRQSMSSKDIKVGFQTDTGATITNVAKNIVTRDRAVAPSESILLMATRQIAKRLTNGTLSYKEFHPTNPDDVMKNVQRMRRGYKGGARRKVKQIDLKKSDKTMAKRFTTFVTGCLPIGQRDIDFFNYTMCRPWVVPPRILGAAWTIYLFDGNAIGSGWPGTTSHTTNIHLSVQQECGFRCKGAASLNDWDMFPKNVYGDDGMLAVESDAQAAKIIEIYEELGFEPDMDDGAVFLSRYYGETFHTSFVSNILRNFICGERPKYSELITTVRFAVTADLIINHPMYKEYCQFVEEEFLKEGYSRFKTIQECRNWIKTDEAKRELEEYGAANSEQAAEVQSLIRSLTFGGDEITDPDLGALFGLQSHKRQIKYDRSAISLDRALRIASLFHEDFGSGVTPPELLATITEFDRKFGKTVSK